MQDLSDLDALVEASEGFSGSEIEQAIVSGLNSVVHGSGLLDTALLFEELRATRPLSWLSASPRFVPGRRIAPCPRIEGSNCAALHGPVVYWGRTPFLNKAMPLHIRRYSTAAAFLRRAEPWLLQREAEHNLILGLARSLTHSAADYEQPLYFATVEQDSEVVGCAWRTPPYKVGLTRMPENAADLLAADMAQVYETLPAVLGPMPAVAQFAEAWSRMKGVRAEPGMLQRIYKLTEVDWPNRKPPGRMRAATPDDEDVLTDWIIAFGEESDVPHARPRALARELTAQAACMLWGDEQPVTMAAWRGRTPHGARIGYVYTPPEHRGRGYATACITALSQHLLDSGLAFCVLYTNLGNPTSNRIYQRIGYRPVCDVMDYDFRKA